MKTVTRNLVVGRRVTIDTEENDLFDIKCGVHNFLGFDFIVDADENIDNLTQFINSSFKELNKSYLRLFFDKNVIEVPENQIWDHDQIKKCIKENT